MMVRQAGVEVNEDTPQKAKAKEKNAIKRQDPQNMRRKYQEEAGTR